MLRHNLLSLSPSSFGRSDGEQYSREVHKSAILAHLLEAPYSLPFLWCCKLKNVKFY